MNRKIQFGQPGFLGPDIPGIHFPVSPHFRDSPTSRDQWVKPGPISGLVGDSIRQVNSAATRPACLPAVADEAFDLAEQHHHNFKQLKTTACSSPPKATSRRPASQAAVALSRHNILYIKQDTSPPRNSTVVVMLVY
jgi:hypothetical protein